MLSLVLICSVTIASANTVAWAEVASVDDSDDVAGLAPSPLFEGIVNVAYDGQLTSPDDDSAVRRYSNILQYWHTLESRYEEVPLGYVSGCYSTPIIRVDRVDFLSVDGTEGDALFSIPWGDEAYPQFWFENEHSADTTWELPEWLQIDLVPVSSNSDGERHWMRVSIADRTRWYGMYRGGLRTVDAADFVPDEVRVEQERMYGGPAPMFAGSDGRHYAFRIRPASDTSCLVEYGFVVDGITGSVVTCGEAFGGPVLMSQAVGRVDGSQFKLPQPVAGQVCKDGIDLRRISELQRGS